MKQPIIFSRRLRHELNWQRLFGGFKEYFLPRRSKAANDAFRQKQNGTMFRLNYKVKLLLFWRVQMSNPTLKLRSPPVAGTRLRRAP